jgi:rhamnosyltransferase
MKKKIAAYITCYQDEKSTNICIRAIKSQSIEVTNIFIVDNSNPPLSLDSNNHLLLINHYPNNIGIAEGLAKALEWSAEQRYDFLWVFDQDSVPSPDCLERLLETYQKLYRHEDYKIGITAPTPIDSTTGETISGAIFIKDRFIGAKHDSTIDFYECDAPITSGSLISLSVANVVSPPRFDLFIDGVDFDYGLRIKQQGFHNIIVPNAIMYHGFGNPDRVKLLNKDISIQQYSPLRYYYICRNYTYLELSNAQGYYKFTSFIHRIKSMLSKITLIFLYSKDSKILKIWACLIGTYHGLIGKLGKTWQ